MNTLIYISGFVTCASLMGFFIMWSSYLKVKKILNKKDDEVNKYKNENDKIKEDTDKRMARYKSSGWHKNKDKDDPNKYKWDVFFELRKVSVSDDRRKSRFEITNIISGNTKDPEDCSVGTSYFQFYKEWFVKQTGDGWLSNSEVEWVIDLPQDVLRDLKLRDLGIE